MFVVDDSKGGGSLNGSWVLEVHHSRRSAMKFVRLMGVTVVFATAVSPTTTRGGKVDDCYGSANLNCCDFASSNFRIPCQWSPTGYCLGTVYMGHNTITPIQVRPNPTGWTDGSFYVPTGHTYRCEFYTP